MLSSRWFQILDERYSAFKPLVSNVNPHDPYVLGNHGRLRRASAHVGGASRGGGTARAHSDPELKQSAPGFKILLKALHHCFQDVELVSNDGFKYRRAGALFPTSGA